MNSLIRRFYFHFTRRKLQAVFAALLLIFLSLPALQLKFKTEIKDLLEGNSPEVSQYKENLKLFQPANRLIALLSKRDQSVWREADLINLKTWITETKAQYKFVENILSPLSIRTAVFDSKKSQLNFPLILHPEGSIQTLDWDRFSTSYWAPFFLGNDRKSLILSFTLNSQAGPPELKLLTQMKDAPGNFTMAWTGDQIFKLFSENAMKKMSWLNLIGVCALFAFICLLFSSWTAGLFTILSVLLGILPIFGFIGLAGQAIDLLTSNLFLLLLIATIEDVLLVFYFSAKKNTSIERSLEELLLPCFYTSLTTAVAFGSLGVSEIPMVRQFALWSSLGAFTEWFVVFFVVPELLNNFKRQRLELLWLPRMPIFKFKALSFWIKILLLPLVAAPILISKLNYNASPFDIFNSNHPVLHVREKLSESRHWENSIEVVFSNDLPVNTEKSLLLQMQSISNISWIEHPYLMLEDSLTNELSAEMKDLALSQLQFSDYAKKYFAENRHRGFLYIQNSDMPSVSQTKQQLEQICNERCHITGELIAFGEYSRALVRTLSESFIFSLFLILVVLFLICRQLNISRLHFIFASVLWGPCMMVLFFFFTHTAVSLVNCILLSTVVGLSGDFMIQVMFNQKQGSLETSLAAFGPASMLLTFLLVGLCVPFLWSPFGNVQTTGWLLMLSIFLISIGDVLIFKLLLSYNLKIFKSGSAIENNKA